MGDGRTKYHQGREEADRRMGLRWSLQAVQDSGSEAVQGRVSRWKEGYHYRWRKQEGWDGLPPMEVQDQR